MKKTMFFVVLCLCVGSGGRASARTHGKVKVLLLGVSPSVQSSSEALLQMVEDELRRRGFELLARTSQVKPDFVYKVQVLRFAGQEVLRIAEYDGSGARLHAAKKAVIRDLRQIPEVLSGLLQGLIKDAHKGRTRHNPFRWGLGVTGGVAVGWDSRPDKPLFFPGFIGGALLRFSLDISRLRFDLESSFMMGPHNHHTEIAALRMVYRPYLTHISPYIGGGVSYIAQPTMIDGSGPPMFGVGMTLNAGYEMFRYAGVQLLIELQINIPFLQQCGKEELDPGGHDHSHHTDSEFQVWVPSATLKVIALW